MFSYSCTIYRRQEKENSSVACGMYRIVRNPPSPLTLYSLVVTFSSFAARVVSSERSLPFDPPPNWSSAVHSSKGVQAGMVLGSRTTKGCFPVSVSVPLESLSRANARTWSGRPLASSISSSSSSSSLHDRMVSKTHRSSRKLCWAR